MVLITKLESIDFEKLEGELPIDNKIGFSDLRLALQSAGYNLISTDIDKVGAIIHELGLVDYMWYKRSNPLVQ